MIKKTDIENIAKAVEEDEGMHLFLIKVNTWVKGLKEQPLLRYGAAVARTLL